MALKLSTGLRDKMLGMVAIPKAVYSEGIGSSNLAYVDGGAGSDTITDDGSHFISTGFSIGDLIYTYGSTTAGNNLAGVELTAVAAGTLTFATGSVAAAEAFAATTHIVCCKGGSLKDVFKDGVLKIYSGSQPSSPDSAVSGTLLVTVTLSSSAFVAGAFDNGLEFGAAASGAISKATGATWSGAAVASGTAGYFRMVGGSNILEGTVTATSGGGDLTLDNVVIAITQQVTVTSFTLSSTN
jgi:hypothetical protein